MPFGVCRLCPRNCGVVFNKRSEKGYCGGGVKARVARVMLHKWEEPCISGKNGSGAVFFSGCQLKCVYCQNHMISRRSGAGEETASDELAEIFLKLQKDGAHNINLVTPDHYAPQIKEALITAKSRGLDIPVVYNCSGYVTVPTLKSLEGFVDVYLTDFKYKDNLLSLRYSACGDYFKVASAATAEMVRQKPSPVFDPDGMMTGGVIVRHLILPGHTDDSKKVVEYLYNTFGDSIYISIMNQFTPVGLEAYPEINRRLTTLEYDRVVDYAVSLGVKNAYIQSAGASDESFIPDF